MSSWPRSVILPFVSNAANLFERQTFQMTSNRKMLQIWWIKRKRDPECGILKSLEIWESFIEVDVKKRN